MHKRNSTWGVFALAVVLIGAATDTRGQDGQGAASSYPVAAQATDPQMGGYYTQVAAGGQPQAAGTAPPDYSSLPPAGGYDPGLTKRVADLEKQLAQYAKAADAAKAKASAKPLCAPSGRIQLDAGNFTQNPTSVTQYGNELNYVGFRRARIALLGEYEQFDYIVEMDFANRGAASQINAKDQSTGFKDVYIQMRDLPAIGNVRVGHFKECFGLEDLTSDNYTTFMERSVCDEGAFVPGRNDGIMAFNWTENQRATWAIGVFANQTGFDQPPTFQYDHWGLDMPMRVTYLPWYDEGSGGRGLWHVGVDYAFRSAPDHIGTFVSRPECNFVTTPTIINYKPTDVDNWQTGDLETALVYGPLSVQGELFTTSVNRISSDPSTNFWGGYVFVSYFLTGENRPYNRKMGVFDRVRPFENFFRVRTCDGDVSTGRGAWELAYRFSYVDMLDNLAATKANAGAGMATDHTFGVNWYLNPFTKLMFNYVHSIDTSNVAVLDASGKTIGSTRITGGNIDIFEMRCAIDF
jgi:phosphate-selective porin OprO and OprP